MKGFKRGEKGFTLVELLIVVAILGILAAVVIPNVVGLMGRGGKQAFETDAKTVQLAAATFYADTQTGWYDPTPDDPIGPSTYAADLFDDNLWGGNDTVTYDIYPSHYYPTAIAKVGNHVLVLSATVVDENNKNNYRLDLSTEALGGPADGFDIEAHAIWMGLLVNAAGDYESAAGVTDRLNVSPLIKMNSLYLNEVPKSAGLQNGATKPGGYVWVVGKNGVVYGAYEATDGDWYAGFSGAYP